MKSTHANLKKTVLGVALVAALGSSLSASAEVIDFSFNGLFTLQANLATLPTGQPVQNVNLPYYYDPTWGYGLRTQINGTMSFDTATGSGSATIAPFELMNSGPLKFQNITLLAIGNGLGNPGTLVLGNMLFDWNGNSGIPVSIVWDATGLFGAIGTPGFGVGTVISGTGALPASNDVKNSTIQIGPSPLATTNWDTTLVGPACPGTTYTTCIGRNPSGGLPLIADATGVGGSPMVIGPFKGYSINLDVTTLTVVAPVPVPAAVWLLGSGLLGLFGISRRRQGL